MLVFDRRRWFSAFSGCSKRLNREVIMNTENVLGPVLSEIERRAATEMTLAVEFLMTAQRALLRGYSLDHKEVEQPLQWAAGKIRRISVNNRKI